MICRWAETVTLSPPTQPYRLAIPLVMGLAWPCEHRHMYDLAIPFRPALDRSENPAINRQCKSLGDIVMSRCRSVKWSIHTVLEISSMNVHLAQLLDCCSKHLFSRCHYWKVQDDLGWTCKLVRINERTIRKHEGQHCVNCGDKAHHSNTPREVLSRCLN